MYLFILGIYPYEFATSLKLLKKTKQIPEQKQFFSKLNNTGVSDEDYKHAQIVFKTFKCDNMLEYTELYCQVDTSLLAEVMESFRDEVFDECNLDCW